MDDLRPTEGRNLQLIRDAHSVRPGYPGLDCLAGCEPVDATLQVVDGLIVCTACGNALGTAGQLILHVWNDPLVRSRDGGLAHLAFFDA